MKRFMALLLSAALVMGTFFGATPVVRAQNTYPLTVHAVSPDGTLSVISTELSAGAGQGRAQVTYALDEVEKVYAGDTSGMKKMMLVTLGGLDAFENYTGAGLKSVVDTSIATEAEAGAVYAEHIGYHVVDGVGQFTFAYAYPEEAETEIAFLTTVEGTDAQGNAVSQTVKFTLVFTCTDKGYKPWATVYVTDVQSRTEGVEATLYANTISLKGAQSGQDVQLEVTFNKSAPNQNPNNPFDEEITVYPYTGYALPDDAQSVTTTDSKAIIVIKDVNGSTAGSSLMFELESADTRWMSKYYALNVVMEDAEPAEGVTFENEAGETLEEIEVVKTGSQISIPVYVAKEGGFTEEEARGLAGQIISVNTGNQMNDGDVRGGVVAADPDGEGYRGQCVLNFGTNSYMDDYELFVYSGETLLGKLPLKVRESNMEGRLYVRSTSAVNTTVYTEDHCAYETELHWRYNYERPFAFYYYDGDAFRRISGDERSKLTVSGADVALRAYADNADFTSVVNNKTQIDAQRGTISYEKDGKTYTMDVVLARDDVFFVESNLTAPVERVTLPADEVQEGYAYDVYYMPSDGSGYTQQQAAEAVTAWENAATRNANPTVAAEAVELSEGKYAVKLTLTVIDAETMNGNISVMSSDGEHYAFLYLNVQEITPLIGVSKYVMSGAWYSLPLYYYDGTTYVPITGDERKNVTGSEGIHAIYPYSNQVERTCVVFGAQPGEETLTYTKDGKEYSVTVQIQDAMRAHQQFQDGYVRTHFSAFMDVDATETEILFRPARIDMTKEEVEAIKVTADSTVFTVKETSAVCTDEENGHYALKVVLSKPAGTDAVEYGTLQFTNDDFTVSGKKVTIYGAEKGHARMVKNGEPVGEVLDHLTFVGYNQHPFMICDAEGNPVEAGNAAAASMSVDQDFFGSFGYVSGSGSDRVFNNNIPGAIMEGCAFMNYTYDGKIYVLPLMTTIGQVHDGDEFSVMMSDERGEYYVRGGFTKEQAEALRVNYMAVGSEKQIDVTTKVVPDGDDWMLRIVVEFLAIRDMRMKVSVDDPADAADLTFTIVQSEGIGERDFVKVLNVDGRQYGLSIGLMDDLQDADTFRSGDMDGYSRWDGTVRTNVVLAVADPVYRDRLHEDADTLMAMIEDVEVSRICREGTNVQELNYDTDGWYGYAVEFDKSGYLYTQMIVTFKEETGLEPVTLRSKQTIRIGEVVDPFQRPWDDTTEALNAFLASEQMQLALELSDANESVYVWLNPDAVYNGTIIVPEGLENSERLRIYSASRSQIIDGVDYTTDVAEVQGNIIVRSPIAEIGAVKFVAPDGYGEPAVVCENGAGVAQVSRCQFHNYEIALNLGGGVTFTDVSYNLFKECGTAIRIMGDAQQRFEIRYNDLVQSGVDVAASDPETVRMGLNFFGKLENDGRYTLRAPIMDCEGADIGYGLSRETDGWQCWETIDDSLRSRYNGMIRDASLVWINVVYAGSEPLVLPLKDASSGVTATLNGEAFTDFTVDAEKGVVIVEKPVVGEYEFRAVIRDFHRPQDDTVEALNEFLASEELQEALKLCDEKNIVYVWLHPDAVYNGTIVVPEGLENGGRLEIISSSRWTELEDGTRELKNIAKINGAMKIGSPIHGLQFLVFEVPEGYDGAAVTVDGNGSLGAVDRVQFAGYATALDVQGGQDQLRIVRSLFKGCDTAVKVAKDVEQMLLIRANDFMSNGIDVDAPDAEKITMELNHFGHYEAKGNITPRAPMMECAGLTGYPALSSPTNLWKIDGEMDETLRSQYNGMSRGVNRLWINVVYAGSEPLVLPLKDASSGVTATLNGEVFTDFTVDAENGVVILDEVEIGEYVIAVVPQYTVALTSRIDGAADASVAALTGGGVYENGAQATVKAPEVPGCSFKGWYAADEQEMSGYAGDVLCETLEYSFDVKEDVSLVAVYESNAPVTLRVYGTDFMLNGAGPKKGHVTTALRSGSQVALEYVGQDAFLHWKNGSDKIVSTSAEYAFVLAHATDLSMVTVEAAADGQYALVEFVSDYGQVLSADTWYAADAAADHELPTGPSKPGYRFKGWELTAEQILEQIDGTDTHITVKPVYTQFDEDVACIVSNNVDDIVQTLEAKVGQTLWITAPVRDGWSFAHMEDEQGRVLTYSAQYAVWMSGDMQIRLVYTAGDQSAAAQPVIAMTGGQMLEEDGVQKAVFSATRDVPAPYVLVAHGMLIHRSGTLDADRVEEQLVIGSEYAERATSSDATAMGTYVLNVRLTDPDATVYARGFLTYRDPATGKDTTVYTDVMALKP